MDSIFRDLKLNNPSNNLKTLGNQRLNPYNECCFGQQCASAFIYAGCYRNVLDDWLTKSNGRTVSETMLLRSCTPFIVQRKSTFVRIFCVEDGGRTFALVTHSDRKRPEGDTPFYSEMIDQHNAYADKVFIDMVRSIQRNGEPVYTGGFTNVPVFDDRNGRIVGYVNAEARAACWKPGKDWDILKK